MESGSRLCSLDRLFFPSQLPASDSSLRTKLIHTSLCCWSHLPPVQIRQISLFAAAHHMDVVGSTDGANSPGGLLARRGKNRNKKGLALGSEAAKPGTLMGASAADLLQAPAPLVGSSSSSLSSTMTSPVGSLGAATPRTSEGSSRPQPIQVAGSSRSNRTSIISLSSDTTSPLPSTPSLSSSSASSRSYHNQLNEQLATLELGVEFKKRPQDGKMKHIAFIYDPDRYWYVPVVIRLPFCPS